ncbi:hypothetical protein H2204_008405 [Knufia peltigerae]|uniref:Acyl-coenzyme A oxidase n=1 Tax=Knufia peltigerae TaxID=1002370 RepID=A0AA38Y154_9EURO|nr:hypothetical protein H2204_008405 [Knufia peltigerae]
MDRPSWVGALQPTEPCGSALLARERQGSTLNTDEVANYIYTEQGLQRQGRLLRILENDAVFDKTQNYFEDRVERYKRSLRRAKRLAQLNKAHHWDEEDLLAAIELVGEPTSFTLHWTMFIPTIRQQGTLEQHDLFLKKAENLDIIGCYAQTELGHGSNVRGLETTATWSPVDRAFILNSPALTASKWWIGTLGRTANHAIVMAQLIIDGKNHGPHPFICQIRDLITHEPLEGVYVGDVGPKMGYNTMDNGFLLFKKVKIPHVNMLARFARVDPQSGRYVKPASPALVYGTLTMLRSSIVLDAGRALARGATIATRYCAIRRQFSDRDQPIQTEELQVLDYPMVQNRLFPLIATAFAMHITGTAMMALYKRASESLPGGNASSDDDGHSQSRQLFAELHATSCGLKALATTAAAEGLEVARRACGGHGYSSFSGIGPWYADYVPTTTWEGDNFMLTLQVAKYSLGVARDALGGKPPHNATSSNLSRFHALRGRGCRRYDLSRDEHVVEAFAWRAADMTFKTLRRRDEDGASWKSLQVDCWRLSTAHSQYLAVKAFYDDLTSAKTRQALNAESREILWKLFRLYSLVVIEMAAHEFYTSSALKVGQVEEAIHTTKPRLLAELRPHAVRLVDAWRLPDWLLDSSLGRYDGRVYEDLFFRATQLNPLNRFTPSLGKEDAGVGPNSGIGKSRL